MTAPTNNCLAFLRLSEREHCAREGADAGVTRFRVGNEKRVTRKNIEHAPRHVQSQSAGNRPAACGSRETHIQEKSLVTNQRPAGVLALR
jgi:hypothetical protein